ncbi:energy transducer TonB [Marinimicrobium agarilyticum]|uniref:energy transducer TonB n=1 Tax=Marinimicrobium agarilyticum TaxID=306546 RepID=UPI0003F4DA65|nr:energy transducer TonB [Marinimicrobium agarilyticum]
MRASQICAPPMAVVTTAGLLLLMYSLINTDFEVPLVTDRPTIESVVMPKTELEVMYPDPAVRPDPPASQPEPIVEPLPDTRVATVTDINIGVPQAQNTDPRLIDYTGGDLMPIVKVAPQYPRVALTRGLEGFVTVSYTVTETGRTRNIVVLEAITKDGKATSVFDRAAIAAAEQFKYQPRVQDGTAVEVHGVKNRFVFELD